MKVDKFYGGVPAPHIGAAIRAARKACGLAEWQLAEQAGISRQTVVQCELGYRYPTLATLAAIARVLGVSADEIKRGSNRNRRES